MAIINFKFNKRTVAINTNAITALDYSTEDICNRAFLTIYTNYNIVTINNNDKTSNECIEKIYDILHDAMSFTISKYNQVIDYVVTEDEVKCIESKIIELI